MKKFTIPMVCPEGWIPIAFRPPLQKEDFVEIDGTVRGCYTDSYHWPRLIVEKIKPTERTFRLVSEKGGYKIGQFGIGENGSMMRYEEFYDWDDGQVWEEVTSEH